MIDELFTNMYVIEENFFFGHFRTSMYDSRARERRRQIEEQEALAAQLLRQVSAPLKPSFTFSLIIYIVFQPLVTSLIWVMLSPVPSACLKRGNAAQMWRSMSEFLWRRRCLWLLLQNWNFWKRNQNSLNSQRCGLNVHAVLCVWKNSAFNCLLLSALFFSI